MAKYRKKPVEVEATQWFEDGGHPAVQPYANPAMDHVPCKACRQFLSKHGYVMTLEGGHIVCPGDWIITGVKGETYPCKADIFDATYERVGDDE